MNAFAIRKLGVIGAGVMGKALIRGLLDQGIATPDMLWAAARREASCEKVRQEVHIPTFLDYTDELAETDVLLICVKPTGMKAVFDKLNKSGLRPDTLIISIVAGNTIESMEARLETPNPVVRAMTNTPCVVGEGMTAICPGTHADQRHLEVAQRIFDSVGLCLQLDESHFDAVTGLSGSGPAYLYLIMEALADGGVRVGLPRDAALQIVSQTVIGAGRMVRESGRHPAALRDDVTTPAGCTIGALLVMEDGKIRSVLARAVEEATKIAGGLGVQQKD